MTKSKTKVNPSKIHSFGGLMSLKVNGIEYDKYYSIINISIRVQK